MPGMACRPHNIDCVWLHTRYVKCNVNVACSFATFGEVCCLDTISRSFSFAVVHYGLSITWHVVKKCIFRIHGDFLIFIFLNFFSLFLTQKSWKNYPRVMMIKPFEGKFYVYFKHETGIIIQIKYAFYTRQLPLFYALLSYFLFFIFLLCSLFVCLASEYYLFNSNTHLDFLHLQLGPITSRRWRTTTKSNSASARPTCAGNGVRKSCWFSKSGGIKRCMDA